MLNQKRQVKLLPGKFGQSPTDFKLNFAYFLLGIGFLLTLTGVPAYFLIAYFNKKGNDGQENVWTKCVKVLQKLLNVIPQEKSEVLL